MRKTNKKLSRLADDKKGVILVTIIFIVAMALIFITTALTISIATRQRVYTNAKYEQARLTVTSLAQSVWQAIYSQQISDADLVALAKGTSGQGSMIYFNNTDVPGMGLGGTQASAYFYCYNAGDPSKICIEFKCDIDGATDGACQYYTMVLERNKGEDFPPSAFHIPVNLGGGGLLNSCNFGIDASKFDGHVDRDYQVRYNDPNNVAFIHNMNLSNQDGCGYYCHLLTDGILSMPDGVYAWDVYFMGAGAGLDLNGPGQNNPARRNTDGSYISSNPSGTPQYGDLYFWGTTNPFRNGASTAIRSDFTFYGVNDINFDLYDDGSSRTGFSGGVSLSNQNLQQITGYIEYESGISVTSAIASRLHSAHSEGWDPTVDAGMDAFMHPDADQMDTIDEVIATYGAPADIASSATALDLDMRASAVTIGAGTYVIDSLARIRSDVTLDLSSGSIIILVTNGANIVFDTGNTHMFITNASGSNRVVFLLDNNPTQSQIILGGDSSGNCGPDGTGIIDVACYSGSTSDIDLTKINQTVNPACFILSLYTGGTPVRYMANHDTALTASLGFFPQSDPNGGGGGRLFAHACDSDILYYGRISAGGIETDGANSLQIPYCPPQTDDSSVRNYAYRDNTDFSVVAEECEYFTA